MNRPKSAAVVAALAGFAASATAQDIFWNAGSGIWSDPFNWSPQNVPDNTGENARLLGASAFMVTLDVNPAISILELDPAATLDIPQGRVLYLYGDTINNGLITINQTTSSLDSYIIYNLDATISGTGTLRLGGDTTDSALYTSGGITLTNASTHTIDGTGTLAAGVLNEGTIASMDTGFGATLTLNGTAKTNNGTIEARAGSTLVITGTTITQGGSGVVVARDGGTVQLAANQTLVGGSIDNEPGGTIVRLGNGTTTISGLRIDGTFGMDGGSLVLCTSADFNCPGTLAINDTASSLDSYIQFNNNCTAMGGGEIFLGGGDSNSDSAVYTAAGATLTIDPAFTIGGSGEVHADLVNNGLIDAYPSAHGNGRLRLIDGTKANHGMIVAEVGGVIEIYSTAIAQGPTGAIIADGGTVEFSANSSVSGGTIDAVNGGEVHRAANGTLWLADTTIDGDMLLDAGGVILLNGASLVVNQTFFINDSSSSLDAYIQSDTNCTVSGVGSIFLAGSGNDSQLHTSAGAVLTLAPGATIEGSGDVHAAMLNQGLVRTRTGSNADGRLRLLGSAKTNEGVMKAEASGVLDIYSVGITQSAGGLLLADEGLVEFTGNPSLAGGTLDSINGGSFSRSSNGTLYLGAATLEGDFYVQPYGLVLFTGNSFVNNGLIVVNDTSSSGDGYIQFDSVITVSGQGTVFLGGSGNDSQILTSAGAIVTFGPDQSVTGSGEVYAQLVNEGAFRAFPSTNGDGRLRLLGSPKTNNGTMTAETGGILDLTSVGVTQTAGGVLMADGGVVEFNSNPSLSGGTLDTANGGRIIRQGNGTLYLGNTTLEGDLEIMPYGLVLITGNEIINNASILVNDTTSSGDGYLQFNDVGAINGAGRVLLGGYGNDSQILCSAGAIGTFGPDQTVEGDGEMHGTYTVQGTLKPGLPIGTIGGGGSLTMSGSAMLDVEANGNPGNHDRVARSGNVNIAGTLKFRFIDTPTTFPAVYDVVSAQTLTGAFDTLDLPAPIQPNSAVYVGYNATTAYVAFTCLPDNSPPFGVLDLADVTGFVNAFLAHQPQADLAAPYGIWDLQDVLAFVGTFTAGCP
ncbi:MAG: hypothetical protein H6810_06210 [Phycisphaeraceae bacterium]|nr:MAG: hypothetical protein H6810_06210 [Phycisphaeraceae bacterium]